MALRHGPDDEAIVARQLGRPARGDWAVAARCHLGIPTVIENHPTSSGEPFPTLFWLTCPLLVRRASRLEAQGHMRALNLRLGERPELRARLGVALGRYLARRDSLGQISDAGSAPGGGAERVKCLHAHLAHELVDPPNPVGAETLMLCGYPDCREPCVGSTR